MKIIILLALLHLAYCFKYNGEFPPADPILENGIEVPLFDEEKPAVEAAEYDPLDSDLGVPSREPTNAHDGNEATGYDTDQIPVAGKHYNRARCGQRGGYHKGRVVGGFATAPGEFPWQVSLQVRDRNTLHHICGGAIIDRQWVITAAHCVHEMPIATLNVVGGDYNLFVREGTEERRLVAATFTNHFGKDTFDNDIALLKLNRPFNIGFNPNISTICLPSVGQSFDGLATVTGWGRLSENGLTSDILREVTIPLISKRECLSKYSQVGFTSFLHRCNLCTLSKTESKDACQGDSGGPLICKSQGEEHYLCGIVSWGLGCARPDSPGVYTEVSCFVDWIRTVMASSF